MYSARSHAELTISGAIAQYECKCILGMFYVKRRFCARSKSQAAIHVTRAKCA